MDDRLDKIIENSCDKFEEWIKILNNHQKSISFHNEFNFEDESKLIYQTVDVLKNISSLAIKYGSFKDNFDTSKMSLGFYGPTLIIKSIKTGKALYLSSDLGGLYLETELCHSENIKNMDDDFWLELFELKKFKRFEYLENTNFSIQTQRKYPELFHTYKNTIYLMFRQFFLSKLECYEDIDLGSLKVKWKADEEDFTTIIQEICLAFKSMYKMNYKLWKVTDLKNKKSLKNKNH